MAENSELTDLVEACYLEGCQFYQQGIRALMRGDTTAFEIKLKDSAKIGLGGLEKLVKIYLNSVCRAELSSSEIEKLEDRNTRFPLLLKIMGSHAVPILDPDIQNKIIQDKYLRNDNEHLTVKGQNEKEKPTPQALFQALERLGRLIHLYLPLSPELKSKVDKGLQLLQESTPGVNISPGEVLRLFGNKVRLVDPNLVTPATENEIRQYYEGAPLDWKVIFGGGDVERDQRNALTTRYAQPAAKTRLVCVSGEPGSGKSTLAWRVAWDIAFASGQPLLHIRNNQSDEPWYAMETGLLEWGGSLVVLADDLFRYDETVRAIESLSPDLPLLIIATSKNNELHKRPRVSFDLDLVGVAKPSASEKQHVLDRFESTGIELQPEQRQRLLKANLWWLLMIEVTTGKRLEEIVEDLLGKLAGDDPVVYRAVELLCFFGQHDLQVPTSLVETVDSDYYNISERRHANGVVFSGSEKNHLRSLHPKFASQALKHYHTNPAKVSASVIQALDPKDTAQQNFIINWLKVLLGSGQARNAHALLDTHAARFAEMIDSSSIHNLYSGWAAIFRAAGKPEEEMLCEVKARAKEPETAEDWIDVLKLQQSHQNRGADLPVLERCMGWYSRNIDKKAVLYAAVTFVETQNDEEISATMLREIDRLLNTYPHDLFIRIMQVKLAGKFGSIDLKRRLVKTTLKYLRENPSFWPSMSQYISFIGKYGSRDEDCKGLINDAIAWLEKKPADESVLKAIFNFVIEHGSFPQQDTFLEQTRKWLFLHPEETHLRNSYYRVMTQRSDPAGRSALLDEQADWIAAHEDDIELRSAFMILLREFGTPEQRQKYFPLLEDWLECHPEDSQFRATFLASLRTRLGTEKRVRKWIELTGDWLATHEKVAAVQISYMHLLERWADLDRCQAFITESIQRLKGASEDRLVLEVLLSLVQSRGTPAQKTEILEITEAWIEKHPTIENVLEAYLHSVLATRDRTLSSRAVKRTSAWLDQYALGVNVWDSYLSLIPLIDTDGTLLQQEISRAERWMEKHPQSSNLRAKIMKLVEEHGAQPGIEPLIDQTSLWLAENQDNSNVRSAFLMLVAKHGTPDQVTRTVNATVNWVIEHSSNGEVLSRYLLLVKTKDLKGEFDRAYSLAKIWLEDHPNSSDSNILSSAGVLAFNMGKFHDAASYLERALKVNHKLYNEPIVLAWSYYYIGEKGKALEMFQSLARKSQVIPKERAFHQLGLYHLREKNYYQAIRYFNQSISLNPERYGAYWELGRAYLAQGDARTALRYFISAKARLPKDIKTMAREDLQKDIDTAVAKSKS